MENITSSLPHSVFLRLLSRSFNRDPVPAPPSVSHSSCCSPENEEETQSIWWEYKTRGRQIPLDYNRLPVVVEIILRHERQLCGDKDFISSLEDNYVNRNSFVSPRRRTINTPHVPRVVISRRRQEGLIEEVSCVGLAEWLQSGL